MSEVLHVKNDDAGAVIASKIAFESNKCDFFKVQDNDTTIRLGEKEHQTDVSSALKRLYDHLSPS